jgi:hypothetical protein
MSHLETRTVPPFFLKNLFYTNLTESACLVANDVPFAGAVAGKGVPDVVTTKKLNVGLAFPVIAR